MSEALMIKLVAGALFVGIPMLAATILERALRRVSDEALRRCFWSLLVAASLNVVVLVALNPGRSDSADMKTFGNVLAGVAIASFFAALIVGGIAKRRRG